MSIVILLLFSITPKELLLKVDEVRLPKQYEATVLMKNHLQDEREVNYRFKIS